MIVLKKKVIGKRTTMNTYENILTYWGKQVKELLPQLHPYQQNAIAFCVQGIVQAGSAVMQKVAETLGEYLDNDTKMVSHEKRLQRFTENERIDVEECWNTLLEQILPSFCGKKMTLVLDPTPYTDQETIVYLGILVYRRVLPIGWCIMPQQEEWDEDQWEIVGRLFVQVARYLEASECTLLADRGLSCLTLIKLCQAQGWHYVLRIKQGEWMRKKYRHFYQDWVQSDQWIKKEGDQWYGQVLLWQEHQFPTGISICWEEGYEEPWILVSDLLPSHKRVNDYRKRMKVEATFQDQKSRLLDIERCQFKKREHLHRWLFAVFLAIWWMMHLGTSCVHHGHRDLVDRADRRDKGIMRIGHLWFKQIQKKARRDYARQAAPQVMAQLAHCLPFFHEGGYLRFSIYLK
jgi:Transposase DDE domain